ncbi:MAG: hypothetical protein EAY75_11245 [Bacteroidetes bacterium]|nr:MAG: hypothetical protein EAY75_11245 [Bacteroidota bacterium]
MQKESVVLDINEYLKKAVCGGKVMQSSVRGNTPWQLTQKRSQNCCITVDIEKNVNHILFAACFARALVLAIGGLDYIAPAEGVLKYGNNKSLPQLDHD